MRLAGWVSRFLVAASAALALAGCEKAPFEKAGKAVDHAAEKAGEKIREISK